MGHPLVQNLPLTTARQQGQIPLGERAGTKTSSVSSFFQLLRSFLNIVNRKEENTLSKAWLPFPYLYNLLRALFRSPIGQNPQEIFVSFLSSFGKVPGTEIVVFDKTCIATDETVRLIKPMLKKERGIKRMNLKCFLTAMFLRIKHGLPLRAIPPQLGSWSTIDGLFRRYSEDGTWEKIYKICVSHSPVVDTSILAMDTCYGKCAREACSLFVKDKRPRNIGKSKGGYTTKILVICDRNLFPVDFATAPGNRNDAPMGYEAIERIKDFERKGALISDKGFDSQRSRKEGQTAGFQMYIPHRIASSGKPSSQENKELETLIDLVQGLDKTDDILEDKAKRTQILSLIERITHKKKERSFTRKNIGHVTTHSRHDDPYDPELNEVNAAVYAHRNVAERSIGRIKDMKAISFRRVRCRHIYDSFIAMAMMFIFYLPQ